MHFTYRFSAILLFCTVCLAARVAAAPMFAPSLITAEAAARAAAAAEDARQPVLNAVRSGQHWVLEADSVPRLSRSDRAAEQLIRSPIKITRTNEGVRISHTGSTPRLVRFPSNDAVYIVRPGTTEMFTGLQPRQADRISVERLSRNVRFSE